LVLDVIHQEVFERKWEECARSFEEKTMGAAPPTKGTKALAEKEAPPPEDGRPSGKRRRLASGAGDESVSEAAGQGKAAADPSKMMAIFKEASKLKTTYNKHTSEVKQLVDAIARNDVFKWANNAENLGELKRSLESLESKLTPVQRGFLIQDLSGLKRRFTDEVIQADLEAFQAHKPELARLKKAASAILAMHKCRS
jgi:hypothetical protein